MAKDPYKDFRIESGEVLDKLAHGVLQLENGTAAPELVPTLLRLAHTLKGAARVVKQPEIAERAHSIEDVLTRHREGHQPLTSNQGSELLKLLDQISERVSTLESAPRTDTTTSV